MSDLDLIDFLEHIVEDWAESDGEMDICLDPEERLFQRDVEDQEDEFCPLVRNTTEPEEPEHC